MSRLYTTITGRRFDLDQLAAEERALLGRIEALFRERPAWDEFSQAWIKLGREMLWKDGRVPVGHPVYRICQDLAARLGIAEGRLARPDYRDRLADLIEERFGSRYHFCKQTGIDQAHLSRVLAGKKHLAPGTLSRILEALGVELALVDREGLADLEPLDLGPAPSAATPGPVEATRDDLGRIVKWVARGLEVLEHMALGPRPGMATQALRARGAVEAGQEARPVPQTPTLPTLDRQDPGGRWRVVATATRAGGTALLVTGAQDSTRMCEGWSVQIDVGGRQYGPEVADEAGDVTLEDLPFEPEALRRAELTIVPDVPIEPAEARRDLAD